MSSVTEAPVATAATAATAATTAAPPTAAGISDVEPAALGPYSLPAVRGALQHVQRMAAALELSDEVCCCAQRWCALFVSMASDASMDLSLLATTVMYLAAKSQESPRQLRDVVNVSFRCLHPHRPPLSVGSLYERLRESVVNSELIVLRYLQFDTRFESPHKLILHIVNIWEHAGVLWRSPARPSDPPQAATFDDYLMVANTAAALLNDMHTMLPAMVLALQSSQQAHVALLAACNLLALHLLPFHADGFGIWRTLWPDIRRPVLQAHADRLLQMLALPPPVEDLSTSLAAERAATTTPTDERSAGDEAALERLEAEDRAEEEGAHAPQASPRTQRNMELQRQRQRVDELDREEEALHSRAEHHNGGADASRSASKKPLVDRFVSARESRSANNDGETKR